MTATDTTTGVERTAARAALAVPGVVELSPTLRQALAGAATGIRQALGSPVASAEAGIRAERPGGTGTWHLDVRCAVAGGRRALDIAREVHDEVLAAVATHVSGQGTPARVTVTVAVTRVAGPGQSLRSGSTAP